MEGVVTKMMEARPKATAEDRDAMSNRITMIKQDLSGFNVSDFFMEPMSPREFCDERAGSNVPIEEIRSEIAKHVPDFMETMGPDTEMYCIGYVNKTIFQFGPDSRTVKEGRNNLAWLLHFPDGGTGFTIKIGTYKGINPPSSIHESNNCISLTMKQASLLALSILHDVVCAVPLEIKTVFTPLAGAVFSKVSLNDICASLVRNRAYGGSVSYDRVISNINCSAQAGGHQLPHSSAAVAMLCALHAVSGMKNKTDAKNAFNRVVKQYVSAGKKFNENEFKSFAPYASGGVPVEMTLDNIKKSLDDINAGFSDDLKKRTTPGVIKEEWDKMIEDIRNSAKQGKEIVAVCYNESVDAKVKAAANVKLLALILSQPLLSKDDYNILMDKKGIVPDAFDAIYAKRSTDMARKKVKKYVNADKLAMKVYTAICEGKLSLPGLDAITPDNHEKYRIVNLSILKNPLEAFPDHVLDGVVLPAGN